MVLTAGLWGAPLAGAMRLWHTDADRLQPHLTANP